MQPLSDLRGFDLNLLVVFEVLMEERSVTRSAQRLGRTQSAISHALSRLRQQLSDPLLVKTASGMAPSPLALALIEEIRPVLRRIGRSFAERGAFDPSTSNRVFRLALPDVSTTIFSALIRSLRSFGPGIALEWVDLRQSTLSDVVDGHVDLAFAPAAWPQPDGTDFERTSPLRIACFARKGHPAFENWSAEAWGRCAHALVGVDAKVANPIAQAAAAAGIERTISARVPHFTTLAPLLAETDLIATVPAIALHDYMALFALDVRQPPLDIPPMPHAIFWSSRLRCDPASVWIRSLMQQAIEQKISEADGG